MRRIQMGVNAYMKYPSWARSLKSYAKKRHGGGSKYNIKNDPTWQQAYKSIKLFELNRHEFAHDKSICF